MEFDQQYKILMDTLDADVANSETFSQLVHKLHTFSIASVWTSEIGIWSLVQDELRLFRAAVALLTAMSAVSDDRQRYISYALQELEQPNEL